MYQTILSPALDKQNVTQGQFVKWCKAGFNSEFSFSSDSCLIKAQNSSLHSDLPTAVGEQMDSYLS